MRADDIDAVLAVQAACYPPAMQESRAVLAARLQAAPVTSLVAVLDGAVCAYVFAYPSTLGAIAPLDTPFLLPAAPDTLYLHDLAVAPRAHGRGLAKRLAAQLLERARSVELAHSALVAVQGSRPFWESLGYAVYAPAPAPDRLSGYPPGTVYMSQFLNI